MAERRMFSLKIVDTDKFIEMPVSARLLYYDLSMRADDEGFVGSPQKILKMVGCSTDDFKILIGKQFIIPFESGICVIKDWKIHNYIQADRYKPTLYKTEKSQLNQGLNAMDTKCIQNVSKLDTQVRLGKDRLGKDRLGKENNSVDKPHIPPVIDDVFTYCKERNNKVDVNKWFDFYASKGWMIGKNKMKDWKAAVRTWEKSANNDNNKSNNLFMDIGKEEGLF